MWGKGEGFQEDEKQLTERIFEREGGRGRIGSGLSFRKTDDNDGGKARYIRTHPVSVSTLYVVEQEKVKSCCEKSFVMRENGRRREMNNLKTRKEAYNFLPLNLYCVT